MSLSVAEVVDEKTLRRRVVELGDELAAAYIGDVPVLVGVLAGSMFFMADLVRAMDIELEVDFLAVSRFGEGGRVGIAMDTDVNLEGRHVIIVEDIVDTGLTLAFLREMLATRDAATVATVTLLDKAPRRIVDVPLEYRGFEVGDEFLLGYGLDWEGRYRNLTSLWAVLDMEGFRADPGVLAAVGYAGAR